MRTDKARRVELAEFLRDRRARLRPDECGIKRTERRRAAGLRREEVAAAAGISTTWYIWLEQGRDVQVSPHTLRAIGRALRLDKAERAYLHRLARPDIALHNPANANAPSGGLLSLMQGLAPYPAYLVDAHWRVVACNRPADLLLGLSGGTAWSGNLIARLFLDPDWRTLFADWPVVARASAAQFRLATAGMTEDAALAAFIARLEAESGEFRACWHDRELAEPPIWQKTIRHPGAGEMTFDFASLRPAGEDSGYFLSIYTPADEDSRARLTTLVTQSPE